jgi:hypothetical protein
MIVGVMKDQKVKLKDLQVLEFLVRSTGSPYTVFPSQSQVYLRRIKSKAGEREDVTLKINWGSLFSAE